MKKIIMFILMVVAFVLAASKPAENRQFREGEWWYCKTIETDAYGTPKNITSSEGAKHAMQHYYQDGLLIKLVEYTWFEGESRKCITESYFNSCKDIVEENYISPGRFTVSKSFKYKYNENCQISEKRMTKAFTDDSSGKTNHSSETIKYTYKNNKIIEKHCMIDRYGGKEYCSIWTTIINGNKRTKYSDKRIYEEITTIDENTKQIRSFTNFPSYIEKTFKESDTKYHKCTRIYLD